MEDPCSIYVGDFCLMHTFVGADVLMIHSASLTCSRSKWRNIRD